jgi:DNA (cytosine-5)-methyltransferase 1
VHHPKTGRAVSAALYLLEELANNYVVYPLLADLADFGVPQRRKRSFLTFIRRREPAVSLLKRAGAAPYPATTHEHRHVTLQRALKNMKLPPLDARSLETATDPRRPLHSVPVWSERVYRMVAAIPRNTDGSAWQNNECPECGRVQVTEEDATCPYCFGPLLRPVIVEKDGQVRLIRGFRSSSYTRMDPKVPAATVTTASGHIGSDRTIHPWENRVLSPIECARLQTFPHDFDWGDSLRLRGPTNIRDMIGEAIPPKFTAAHGRVLMSLLNGMRPKSIMKISDRRVSRADAALKRNSLPPE